MSGEKLLPAILMRVTVGTMVDGGEAAVVLL